MIPRHFPEEGRFSPFTYSVGLESSFAEAEDAMQNYPLAKPVSAATLASFLESLTFFHEAGHVCQFISTAYGLRALRYTLVALRALSKLPGLKLPILKNLMNVGRTFTPDELRVVDASLLFLDTIDQLRFHHQVADGSDVESEQIFRMDEPWVPHFFVYGEDDLLKRREYAEELRKTRNVHVRTLPHLRFERRSGIHELVVTAAALMEAYGIIVELNHVFNAFTSDAEMAIRALPTRPEYHLLLDYALAVGACEPRVIVPTMAILIDAALMYDPFVLYNVPWDVADAEGRGDRYPGQTFMELCAVAREIEPIRAFSPEVLQRFYRQLCERAGLPDPEWMAQKSLEVAQGLLDRNPGEGTLLYRALVAHRDALKLRCDRGLTFACDLPSTETIYQLVEIALPAMSFYNLHTRLPEGFDPRKIDAVSVHSILFQAIVHPTMECPLRLGNPFFCASATSPADKLCVWRWGDGDQSECLLDVLEREFELVSEE